MGYNFSRYTPAWLGDYLERYNHLIDVTFDDTGYVTSMSFIGQKLELDHCSYDRIRFKTYTLPGISTGNRNQFQVRLFYLTLYLDGTPGDFCITEDLKLSNEMCIHMFENDINIRYDNGSESVYYDRQAIMRKHTIENILK